jgi:Flp pilus assembly protein TadD
MTGKLSASLLLCGLAAGLVAGCAARTESASLSQAPTDAADAEWQASTGRTPTVRTMLALGRTLVMQRRFAEAEMVFTRILRQDPAFLAAYVDLADMLVRQRRTGQAINVLSAGLKVAPNDAVLRNDLGMIYLAEGKHAQALAAFEQACRSDPQNSRYVANRAVALGILGRYDEAYAMYRRVVSAADAHHNLVLLSRARRSGNQARQDWSLADGAAPTNSPSQANKPTRVTDLPANRGD